MIWKNTLLYFCIVLSSHVRAQDDICTRVTGVYHLFTRRCPPDNLIYIRNAYFVKSSGSNNCNNLNGGPDCQREMATRVKNSYSFQSSFSEWIHVPDMRECPQSTVSAKLASTCFGSGPNFIMGPSPTPRTPTNGYFFVSARYTNTNPPSSTFFTPISFTSSLRTKAIFFVLETYALTQSKELCPYQLKIQIRGRSPEYICLSYDYKEFYYTYTFEADTQVDLSIENKATSRLIDLKLWMMLHLTAANINVDVFSPTLGVPTTTTPAMKITTTTTTTTSTTTTTKSIPINPSTTMTTISHTQTTPIKPQTTSFRLITPNLASTTQTINSSSNPIAAGLKNKLSLVDKIGIGIGVFILFLIFLCIVIGICCFVMKDKARSQEVLVKNKNKIATNNNYVADPDDLSPAVVTEDVVGVVGAAGLRDSGVENEGYASDMESSVEGNSVAQASSDDETVKKSDKYKAMRKKKTKKGTLSGIMEDFMQPPDHVYSHLEPDASSTYISKTFEYQKGRVMEGEDGPITSPNPPVHYQPTKKHFQKNAKMSKKVSLKKKLKKAKSVTFNKKVVVVEEDEQPPSYDDFWNHGP